MRLYLRFHPHHVVGPDCTLKMASSCSSSTLVGKRGLPMMSSAKMQPTPQQSTLGPYRVAPSKSSGGRYHSVITRLVRSAGESLSRRASPKSASWSTSRTRVVGTKFSTTAALHTAPGIWLIPFSQASGSCARANVCSAITTQSFKFRRSKRGTRRQLRLVP